jgi:PQQ-dependent catabolism-associated CXXCW motif protein
MTGRLAGALALLALPLMAMPSWPQSAPTGEPDGYRMEDYRAPTPPSLKGAQVLTTREAEALWKAGTAAFVDVLPRPPRPAALPAGTIWHDAQRLDIPGSIWLPNTGFGALAAVTEAYLRRGLERARAGADDRLLVIYCQRDCWQSWNAAKRALALGYRHIAWYPEGTDGWHDAGLPLENATPAP